MADAGTDVVVVDVGAVAVLFTGNSCKVDIEGILLCLVVLED